MQTYVEPAVVYLEHMSKETIDVAKSHTSWMNFKDNSQFQDIEQNPFNFQYIKAITKLEEFRNMAYWPETNRLKPLIIITSMASMSQGYSRQILREFTARDQNEIVFIERQNGIITRDSIAGKLFLNMKQFMIDEISVVQEPSTPAKKETPSNLKPNDPRGKSSLNKVTSEPASIARKQSHDDAMNELRRACMQDD